MCTPFEWVTFIVAVVAAIVATMTFVVNNRAVNLQRRDVRRAFAEQLNSYALWYCERVVSDGAADPGPTDALSDDTFALAWLADSTGETGAKDLYTWSMGLLNEARNGSSRLRPYEEPEIIAQVSAAWVGDLKLDVMEHAENVISKRNPKQ